MKLLSSLTRINVKNFLPYFSLPQEFFVFISCGIVFRVPFLFGGSFRLVLVLKLSWRCRLFAAFNLSLISLIVFRISCIVSSTQFSWRVSVLVLIRLIYFLVKFSAFTCKIIVRSSFLFLLARSRRFFPAQSERLALFFVLVPGFLTFMRVDLIVY